MNLAHDARGPKGLVRGGYLAHRKLSLRSLVFGVISGVAAAAVWRRTGGDVLLTGFAGPLVLSTMIAWIDK